MSGGREDVEVVEGNLDAKGMRIAVVVSRFNDFITQRLLDGALDTLLRLGAASEDLRVVWVPGAWELPLAAEQIARAGACDAIVALGCLMRGDTIHFDLIAGEATKGLGQLGRTHGIPVGFGLLTTDTLEQAVHRAGAKAGNKGGEAAMAAVELASLYRRLGTGAQQDTPSPAPKPTTTSAAATRRRRGRASS